MEKHMNTHVFIPNSKLQRRGLRGFLGWRNMAGKMLVFYIFKALILYFMPGQHESQFPETGHC